MRDVIRKALGFASLCTTAAVMLGVGAFVLFDSDAGRSFVREQTEGVIGGILGPNYRAELGRQTLDLGSNGELMLRWNGVEIYRKGVSQPQVAIRSIAVGFDGRSLLAGRLKARTLEIEGAEIDVTSDPASVEVAATAKGLAPTDGTMPSSTPQVPPIDRDLLPALTSRLLGQIENQLAALGRVGIQDVAISDVRLVAPIAPGGGPFVARVEDLELELADPHAMTLFGRLGIDQSVVPVTAAIDYAADAGKLRSAKAKIGPVALGQFVPPAPLGDTLTEKSFAADTPLTLALDVESENARRHVRLAATLGEGQIQEGRGHAEIRAADIALDYIEGEDRLTIGPNRFLADGLEMALSGSLTPIYDSPGDNAFNGFALDLATTEFRSSLGSWDGVQHTATLTAKARTDLSARLVRVERFDLNGDASGTLGGWASIGYGSPDARLQLGIDAANLSSGTVKAYWPFNVAVGARRWTAANVGDAGAVEKGRIAMDVLLSRFKDLKKPTQAFRPEEIDLDLALRDMSVKSFGSLPNLVGANGALEIHGGDTLVTVDSAKLEGVSNVSVDGGLVSISRAANTQSQQSDIKIVANLGGRLDGFFAVAKNDPIDLPDRLPIRLGEIGGTAKAVADVDLRVGDDAPFNPVSAWRVALDVKDGSFGEPIAGHKLGNIDGTLAVTAASVEGTFAASLDGARGNASFKRSFAENPPDGRRMEASLKVDGGEAAKIVPALEDVLSGPFEVRVAENAQSVFRTAIDLGNASVTLPWIGWRKGKGVAAGLEFSIPSRDDDNDTDINDIVLKGDGFSVTGRAEWDREGLIGAEFGKVAFNPGDDVKASVKRVDNGFTISIQGSQFDARPLLADIRGNIGTKTATPPKRGAEQLDVSAAVERVIGFSKETVGDFSLNYAGSGSRIAALSIAGRTEGKAPFSVDVSPRGQDRAIDIHADDAGALLGFTGAYDHMDGGKLALSLVGSYDSGYWGDVTVKNFTLVDEPRLSRLVAAPPTPGSASLSQAVGRDLPAERATFDHASASIRFGKDGLSLADGIIRGPVFGSSFAGTLYDAKNRIDITGSFMPAYGLNRVFGAIPIVGQILGNGREGGLIGITYRLSGAFSSPKLEINPISAIAPGIFRNIFAYQ